MLINGVKQPKIENKESIEKFPEIAALQNGRHVISSFNGYISNFRDLGLTTIHIFSKEGKLIKMAGVDANSCGPDPALFIKNMDQKHPYEVSARILLDSLTNRFLLPDGGRFVYQRPDSTDFVAVITWAKWVGKKVLTRDVAACVQAITENDKARFQLILLNLDKQEIWGQENLDKIKLTSTSIEIYK